MPSQKRRRPATAGDDAHVPHNTQSTAAASLAGFTLLPLELRQQIVEAACHSSSSSSSSLSPFEADNGTMFNLALVCKEINAQVTPLLWATVTITRPSALYALHQALPASPERARMITSLHIGPQDTLPSYWWPLSRAVVGAGQYTAALGSEGGFTSHWIATSLDASLVPSGCQSREAWRWDRSTPGCRGAAIYEALEVIKATLGLDFRAHGYGSPTTIAPVFEAQAALDMYLTKLRSVEESNPVLVQMAKPGAPIPLACRNRQCQHYPALFITGAPRSARSRLFPARLLPPVEPPSNAFVISYTQLLCHIARRGAITDRFDHPLALARSQFNVIIDVPAETGSQATYQPSKATYKLHSGTWDVRQHEVGQWAGHALLQEAAKQAESDVDQRRYAAAISTATFGSTLQLARSVLDAATSVENLSLTGYLESATPGRVLNPTLNRLSLGPALPCWDAPLDLRLLDGVEELRICGRSMTFYEAGTIALKMLSLKRLVWSLAEPYATKRSQSAENVIHFLLKTHMSADPNTFIQGQPGPRSNAMTPLPPLIIARLHPTDMVEVLRTAPSAEAKAAWLAGREPLPFWSFPFCRKLLLKENPTAIALRASHGALPVIGSDSSSSPIWEEMYREGRSYWRDGEGEAGQIEEEKESAAEEEEKGEEEENGNQSEEEGH